MFARFLAYEAGVPSWVKGRRVLVDSPGGKISTACTMVDYLKGLRRKELAVVEIIVVGDACSAAALLLEAGSPGQRSMLPEAMVMLHQPRHIIGRKVRNLNQLMAMKRRPEGSDEVMEKLRKGKETTLERLVAMSTTPREGWEPWLNDGRNHWFEAEECMKLGLVDVVGAPPGFWPGEGPW
ncbi:MAG: hypothetical protein GC129_05210 [Proteobacteria bacterium]|nr:hypothetical protein [Pseudomonadota bacterium]